jgi:hypothetical protein
VAATSDSAVLTGLPRTPGNRTSPVYYFSFEAFGSSPVARNVSSPSGTWDCSNTLIALLRHSLGTNTENSEPNLGMCSFEAM